MAEKKSYRIQKLDETNRDLTNYSTQAQQEIKDLRVQVFTFNDRNQRLRERENTFKEICSNAEYEAKRLYMTMRVMAICLLTNSVIGIWKSVARADTSNIITYSVITAMMLFFAISFRHYQRTLKNKLFRWRNDV